MRGSVAEVPGATPGAARPVPSFQVQNLRAQRARQHPVTIGHIVQPREAARGGHQHWVIDLYRSEQAALLRFIGKIAFPGRVLNPCVNSIVAGEYQRERARLARAFAAGHQRTGASLDPRIAALERTIGMQRHCNPPQSVEPFANGIDPAGIPRSDIDAGSPW